VLGVPALQIRYPIAVFVLMESHNLAKCHRARKPLADRGVERTVGLDEAVGHSRSIEGVAWSAMAVQED
jgi:hypothetical protein